MFDCSNNIALISHYLYIEFSKNTLTQIKKGDVKMEKIQNYLLKLSSSLALTLAAGSISEASTLFTYQPKIDDDLKSQLKLLI